MVMDVSCLVTMSVFGDFFSCLGNLTGQLIWTIAFMSLMIVIIGGFMYLFGLDVGLMLGGFFATMIGLGMWYFGILNFFFVMVSLSLMIAGITIKSIEIFSRNY